MLSMPYKLEVDDRGFVSTSTSRFWEYGEAVKAAEKLSYWSWIKRKDSTAN